VHARRSQRAIDEHAADEQQDRWEQDATEAEIQQADLTNEYPEADDDEGPALIAPAPVSRPGKNGNADDDEDQRPGLAQHIARFDPAEAVKRNSAPSAMMAVPMAKRAEEALGPIDTSQVLRSRRRVTIDQIPRGLVCFLHP
jgi:hypothetical protein